jgi:peptidoglycan glycosyltransferase
VVRADDLLSRPTNPRVAEEDRRIQRGRILDRNGEVLASSNVAAEVASRTYTYPPLAPVLGYYSTRYGSAGVEAAFDGELRGNRPPDLADELRDRLLPTTHHGADVTLTLDLRLQRAADAALGSNSGAIVALNSATGEVLAMASHPYFDPNKLEQDWADLQNDTTGVLIDRVTSGQYVPGSIFKVITASAALDSGLVTEQTPIRESISDLDVQGFKIRNGNHPGLTDLSFGLEFAWSSNSCFAYTGLGLSASQPIDYGPLGGTGVATWQPQPGASVQASTDRLQSYATTYGIGQRVPFDLPTAPGRFAGHAPLTAAELASTAFGQGELVVSPLQMVLVATTVKDGGDMPVPYLARSVRGDQGERALHQPGTLLRHVMSRQAASQLNDMMMTSVDVAYASPAQISGVRVGGKTGSAEVGNGAIHSWFIGYAPGDRPGGVAVAVIMEEKGSGTTFATPAGKQVLQAALQLGY